MSNAKKQRAVGYVRVSKQGGREGDSFLSPVLQREEIERAAGREGLEIVEVIEEIDVSGREGKKRPGWERALSMVERGEASAVVVYNLSRASRSVQDFLRADGRVRDAGGRLVSAQENLSDDATGVAYRNILLSIAQFTSDTARETFYASAASAVERGIHHVSRIPLGYRRDLTEEGKPTGPLLVDPDAAPVVRAVFERRRRVGAGSGCPAGSTSRASARRRSPSRASGAWYRTRRTWARRATGASRRRTHTRPSSPRGLWRRCQAPGRKSARSGRLTEKYLLQGITMCANCGRPMYLSGGKRHGKDYEHYICRREECDDHAYARAGALDSFVLNYVEEALTGVDADGHPVGPGDRERWLAATFVPRPDGDEAEVAAAEQAVEDARADLDAYLSNTKLARVLGEDKYAETVSDYVAAVNKAEADLAELQERNSGAWELVGRLWTNGAGPSVKSG